MSRFALGVALGVPGAVRGGAGFDYYVDSVNGDDGNSGTSEGQAFATIGALPAISAGKRIGLAKGSTFMEMLTVNANNVTVKAYGAGNPPLFDCRDAIAVGAWSKTGGATNVYQATVSPDLAALETWVSAWEDTTRMVRATSVANCDATANSYYPSADTGAPPITLYVHASDNSNPAVSGKVYKFSKRANAVYNFNNDGLYIEGIDAIGNLDEGGTFRLGTGVRAYHCRAYEGNKHNFDVKGNSELHYCTAQDNYYGTTGSSLFGFYDTVGGKSVLFDHCTFKCTTFDGTVSHDGVIGHTAGANRFATACFVDCAFENVGNGTYLSFIDTVYMTRCTWTNCQCPVMVIEALTYYLTDCRHLTTAARQRFMYFSVDGATVTVTGLDMDAFNCLNTQGVFMGAKACTLTVTDSDLRFTGNVNSQHFFYLDNAGANLTVDGCTFNATEASSYIYYMPNAASVLVSDNNHFGRANHSFNWKGTTQNTVAAWKAAHVPQDANSTVG